MNNVNKRIKIKDKKHLKLSNDLIIRISLSVFFVALFVVLFFVCGGTYYFKKVNIIDKYSGYDFQFHVIDVEQGDCLLFKFPNNQTMLVDAGEEEYGEIVCEYVTQFLKQENLEALDYLVLTHSDADHVGGAKELLENVHVNNIYRPKIYTQNEAKDLPDDNTYMISNTLIYNTIIDTAKEKGCNLIFSEKGMELNLGGCKVEFLSPAQDYYADTNSYSAVIMITYQTKKILLTGDANIAIEQTLIDEYGEYLKADILKVGHHGSKTSSMKEFLEIIKPQYSILCAGENRDLPDIEVINRLHDINSKILSTANEGSFAMTIKNNEVVYSGITTPTFDIAIIISLLVIALILTWGIKINSKRPKAVLSKNQKTIIDDDN